MNLNKRVTVIALIVVLATFGFVAADETGVITINLVNSNSQVVTNVSNSTMQAQTNFTNSQAQENVTLTNSTLTLNVNGQNITITGDENGTVSVSAPGQNAASAPAPAAIVPLNVTSPPSWIEVYPIGMFNDYMVSETPNYVLRVTVNDSAYYQAFEQLYSKNMTGIFPQAFYTDFGLNQIVYPYSNTGGSQFDIAFTPNPNHLAGAYLPDPPNDNSGEKYLYQAVGYYLSQYLQNQTN